MVHSKKVDEGIVNKGMRNSVVLLLGMLMGCGGADENPVPVNATVLVSPNAIEWQIPPVPTGQTCSDVFDPSYYNDHTIAVSVMNANNSPLGDIDLRIIADLAGNTYSGIEVVKVYDDFNGNGVVDDPAELVSSNASPAFTTKTSRNGTKVILVRVNLSCPYRANLNVYAGAAFGSINIEVTENTTTP